jgi:hypothetical protein
MNKMPFERAPKLPTFDGNGLVRRANSMARRLSASVIKNPFKQSF